MKLHTISLLLMLLIISCNDRKNEGAIEKEISQTVIRSEVEFYIMEAPQVGAFSRPEPDAWKHEGFIFFSTGDVDDESRKTTNEYTIRYGYEGSDEARSTDYYSVTITPPNSEPISMDVKFDGVAQQLWKDDRYAVGVRSKETKPTEPKSSTDH